MCHVGGLVIGPPRLTVILSSREGSSPARLGAFGLCLFLFTLHSSLVTAFVIGPPVLVVPFSAAIVLSPAPGSYFDLPRSPMRACPPCPRRYPDNTDFCRRDGALHSAVGPTLRSAHAGLKPGATSVAAVSDRRLLRGTGVPPVSSHGQDGHVTTDFGDLRSPEAERRSALHAHVPWRSKS